MKLNHQREEVLSIGGETSSFGIEMNSAAWEALSSSLYQFKIPAVVRENLCNAYDAHLQAGKEDVPFKIFLPNKFQPNLVIKDEGIGLDDSGVRNVFAYFFRSTKNDSDDITGGFGVGAKSTFTITDNFTIVARKDGVERHYNAYIGSKGVPDVQIFREVSTDECNGVEITIPIAPEYHHRISDEVAVVSSFFPTKPIVRGNDDFTFVIDDVYEQIAERGFARFKSQTGSPLYHADKNYVLMNNVIYPINFQIDYDTKRQMDHFFRARGGLIIPVSDGEFRPAISRETLQGSDEEFAAVNDRINELVGAVVEKERNKILSGSDSIFDMIRKCEELSYNTSYFKLGNNYLSSYEMRRATIPNCTTYERVWHTKTKIRTTYYPTMRSVSRGANVVLVCKPKGDTRSEDSIRKRVRRYMARHEPTYMVVVGNCTDLRLKRIKAVSGFDFSEVMTVDDLFNKTDAARSGYTGLSYDIGEKGDTTIYAKSVESLEMKKARNIDVSDDSRVFFYCTEDVLKNFPIIQQDEDGTPVTILVKSKKNEKKLEKFEIPSYLEFLKEYLEENPAFLDVKLLNEYVQDYGVKSIVCTRLGGHNLLKSVLESSNTESAKFLLELFYMKKLAKQEVDKAKNDNLMARGIRRLPSLAMLKAYGVISEETYNMYSELSDEILHHFEEFISKYRMRNYGASIDINIDETALIKLIDFAESHGYNPFN